MTLDIFSPGVIDPLYDALVDEAVTVDVNDNDYFGVTISVSSGTDVDEANLLQRVIYDVVLDTRPSGPVTLTIGNDGQVGTVQTALNFDGTTWATPQQVEVYAVDDDIVETDPHDGNVTYSISGGDALYNAVVVPDERVDVRDDDVAGVIMAQVAPPTPLDEAGVLPVATYDLVLQSEPTAPVTVTLAADPQVEIVGATDRTFLPGNWNVVQQVQVRAVDDLVTEADPHAGEVVHTTELD